MLQARMFNPQFDVRHYNVAVEGKKFLLLGAGIRILRYPLTGTELK